MGRWWQRFVRWLVQPEQRYVFTLRGWVPLMSVRRGDFGEVGMTVPSGDEHAGPSSRSPVRDEWLGTQANPYPDPDHGSEWRGTADDPFETPGQVGRRRR